jgi:hypothetical protein
MTSPVIPFSTYLNGLHTDYFNISYWIIHPRDLLIENSLSAIFYVLRTSDAELCIRMNVDNLSDCQQMEFGGGRGSTLIAIVIKPPQTVILLLFSVSSFKYKYTVIS